MEVRIAGVNRWAARQQRVRKGWTAVILQRTKQRIGLIWISKFCQVNVGVVSASPIRLYHFIVALWREQIALRLFHSMANHFPGHRAAIEAGQVLFHCGCEQWDVRDFAEVFGNEPDRFICRHPV
jgi:hypothetical protein